MMVRIAQFACSACGRVVVHTPHRESYDSDISRPIDYLQQKPLTGNHPRKTIDRPYVVHHLVACKLVFTDTFVVCTKLLSMVLKLHHGNAETT
jgi:hypothetical protein